MEKPYFFTLYTQYPTKEDGELKMHSDSWPSRNLSIKRTHRRAIILSLLTWEGLSVWEWLVAVKELKACV